MIFPFIKLTHFVIQLQFIQMSLVLLLTWLYSYLSKYSPLTEMYFMYVVSLLLCYGVLVVERVNQHWWSLIMKETSSNKLDNLPLEKYLSTSCIFLWMRRDWAHVACWPTFGLLYLPRMKNDDECGAVGGMISRGNWNTQREPVSVPLCPPQIPHDLTWVRT
jgi:hypothetical protein